MTDTPDTEDQVDEHQAQEFASLLLSLNNGLTHDELTTKFAELVVAVQDTGKGGKVVLTVNVKPAANVNDMVVVSDDVKVVLPELARTATYFYADDKGELSKDHPLQRSMFSIQGEGTK